jgi:hypothetical protein
MAILSQILIYPIKSLDGVAVSQAKILPGGALEHDREFCIVDEQGKRVNGKRTAKIHPLRSHFDLENRTVTISVQQENPETFHLDQERDQLAAWLSDYFGFNVFLQQNRVTGFPDDAKSPGPTMIGETSLEMIASWFSGITLPEMRSRLRTNLELSDVPAFWEDQLYGKTEVPVPFQIGEVQLQGINPCQRCVVPTRNSISGEVDAGFQKTFVSRRQAELPSWVAIERFNHFFRAAVNTRISASEAGKLIYLGDTLSIGTDS